MTMFPYWKRRKLILWIKSLGAILVFVAVVLFLIYGLYPAMDQELRGLQDSGYQRIEKAQTR